MATMTEPCGYCQHTEKAHQHYSSQTYCSVGECDCARYRWGWKRDVILFVVLAAVVVAVVSGAVIYVGWAWG